MKDLPQYLVGSPSSKSLTAGQAIGVAESYGMAGLGRQFSAYMEQAGHTSESLATFLHRRVYETKRANKRANYWWGRFYNWCLGENDKYIKLKGVHLAHALFVAENLAHDANIPPDANCALRLDVAEDVLTKLRADLLPEER